MYTEGEELKAMSTLEQIALIVDEYKNDFLSNLKSRGWESYRKDDPFQVMAAIILERSEEYVSRSVMNFHCYDEDYAEITWNGEIIKAYTVDITELDE